MNRLQLDFINEIHKPCEELRDILMEQLLLEKDSNRCLKRIKDLCSAISHFPEVTSVFFGIEDSKEIKKYREEVKDWCPGFEVIQDVCDMSKHGTLRKESRKNCLTTSSVFEFNEEEKCRFLKTEVLAVYENGNKFEIDELLIQATNWWIDYMNYQLPKIKIKEHTCKDFGDWAALIFDPKHCTVTKAFNLKSVKMNSDGELIPYDPKEFKWMCLSNIQVQQGGGGNVAPRRATP